MKNGKIDLLVNISKLYYEYNYSQQMIAKKLDLSRPYVSRLLKEAKDQGIVEITIKNPNKMETQIEKKIKELFNLKHAVILPVKDSNYLKILEQLGIAINRYLNIIVQDNDNIGVSWGNTLYACAKNFHLKESVNNITIVQLCGGISKIEKNIYATEIPKILADKFHGTPYVLPLPAVVDNLEVKNSILQDKHINKVINIARKSNIAIFTMGTFGSDSALVRAGYINKKEMSYLISKGAVGDICTRIIDIEGNVCDPELNYRTIGIELDELREKEYRIGVAAGMHKVKAIYAALKGGYVNVLFSDEKTVLSILKLV